MSYIVNYRIGAEHLTYNKQAEPGQYFVNEDVTIKHVIIELLQFDSIVSIISASLLMDYISAHANS